MRARRRVVVPGTPAQLGRPRMGWFPRFARIDRAGRAAQIDRAGRVTQIDRAGRAAQVDRTGRATQVGRTGGTTQADGVGRSAGADSGRRARARKRLRGGAAETAPVRLTRRGRAALVLVMALLSLGGFWLGTRAAGHAGVERSPGAVGLSWAQVREVDNLSGAGVHPGEDLGAVADEAKRFDRLTSPPRRTGTRLHGPDGVGTPLHQGQ
ncbi:MULTISPECIES: hypothetical protein [Nonomuraea]|uniref:Uncharacterized protein n=1 Tax=Nonomuraea ferruginea TaxID=46174 RepID=A0ABT4T6Z8_9ACTN|nr:hypothetical protein [Nonomuraea ferruginea]MDA0645283.1 hypothetical protein [Nonomuraea ferruginea]